MNKFIFVVSSLCLVSCCAASVPNQPASNPFAQVQKDNAKIDALKDDQAKNWDAIIDRIYSASDLDVLENINKDVETIRDTSYAGYSRAKFAVLYQRTKLTYWTKK